MKHNKCCHCLEVDADVWERSHVRQLYRNTLTSDFAQEFQNDQQHIDAVQQDRFTASQVIPSHSAKSRDFFHAHGGFIYLCAFCDIP